MAILPNRFSVSSQGFRYYLRNLSPAQRLVGVWILVTLTISLVFFAAYLLKLHNPLLFRYFISLYVIDSLFFFLTFTTSPTIGRTMLSFLVALGLIVLAYYFFSYISISV